MAISYVGGLTVQNTALAPSTQSISLTSLSLANGDLVLVSYSLATSSSDADLSAKISTSGYTQVTELFANDSCASNMAVFRKTMGSTPDTDLVVVGRNTTSQGSTVVISVFRGVDGTNPLDVTTTTATGIDTGNANPAAITPASSGNVIVLFASSGTSNIARTYTTASTAYMSGFQQTNSSGSTLGITSGSGYVTGQSAGVSYDPATWAISVSSTTFSWTAATLALRAPSTPITGTASGTLTISGASTGAAIIAAASSGTLDVTGLSSGATLISATASGPLDVSGVSVGSVAISAAAAGSLDVSGTAVGGAPPVTATASGTLTIGGASTGAAIIAASASGSLDVTGVSQGGTIITGTASSTYTVSGRAVEGISRMRYGEIVVTAAYFGDIPVNVIAVGDHVVLEW